MRLRCICGFFAFCIVHSGQENCVIPNTFPLWCLRGQENCVTILLFATTFATATNTILLFTATNTICLPSGGEHRRLATRRKRSRNSRLKARPLNRRN